MMHQVSLQHERILAVSPQMWRFWMRTETCRLNKPKMNCNHQTTVDRVSRRTGVDFDPNTATSGAAVHRRPLP